MLNAGRPMFLISLSIGVAVGCSEGGAQDDAVSTATTALSMAPSGEPLATGTPVATASTEVSETSESELYPYPWLVDETADQLFGPGPDGLVRVDLRTGMRETLPRPENFDFKRAALDATRRRLYSDALGYGLLVWDIDSLESLDGLMLPLPLNTPESLKGFENWDDRERMPAPIIDAERGRLMVFRDRRLFVVDLDRMVVEREFEAAVSGADGAVLGARYDSSRRILYVWAHDTRIQSTIVGTRIIGLDVDSWRTVFEAEAPGKLVDVAAWDGHLAVVDHMYKRYGIDIRLWRDGELVRHLEGGPESVESVGLAFDRDRERLLMSDERNLWVFDPDRLDLRFVIPAPAPGKLLDVEPDGQGLLFAGDRSVGRRRFPVSDVRPAVADERSGRTIEFGGDRLYTAFAPDGPRSDEVFAWAPEHSCVLHSDDLGESWTCHDASLSANRGELSFRGFVGMVRPDNRLIMLHSRHGYGVFRSEDGGRSWQPSNRGIDHLGSTEFVCSSVTCSDGLVFAFSEPQLYRSTDWGSSWVPVGAFEPPVFATDFESSGRLFSVERDERQVVRSDDSGLTWTRIGALPDGTFHPIRLTVSHVAPDSRAMDRLFMAAPVGPTRPGFQPAEAFRFFRSEDGGVSWTHVKDPYVPPGGWENPLVSGWSVDSQLLTLKEETEVWIVMLPEPPWTNLTTNEGTLLISLDGMSSWREKRIDAGLWWRLRPLQVDTEGFLLVNSESSGKLRWVSTREWLTELGFSNI